MEEALQLGLLLIAEQEMGAMDVSMEGSTDMESRQADGYPHVPLLLHLLTSCRQGVRSWPLSCDRGRTDFGVPLLGCQ